ncbi:carotenoid oxygenase [Chlamydoabsidia padenii]|nr:carotenoid oxygenase [Chlamydoabsidia padenii]
MPFLHRFQLSPTQQMVRYNSRHLATKAEENIGAGSPIAFFGHVSPVSSTWALFKSFLGRFNAFVLQSNLVAMKNTAVDPSSEMVGVTVTPNYPLPKSLRSSSADHVLVTKTDANVIQKVDADSLEPECLYNYNHFDKTLSGELSAAHHQYDPETEEVFNFTLKMGPTPTLTVFSTSARSPSTTLLANITHRKGSVRTPIRSCYIHSFWLTKNYIVIPESPLYLKNMGLDFIVSGSVLNGMEWDTKTPTYLHVISRRPDLGHVASIPVGAFFTFHTCNAWEEIKMDGTTLLTLDCAAFPDGDIMYQIHNFGQTLPPLSGFENSNLHEGHSRFNGFTVPPLHQTSFGEMRRYTLTLDQTACSSGAYTPLADNMEFPRFNQEYSMRPYKYIYGSRLVEATQTEGERYCLIKLNTGTGETVTFDNSNYVCSEPIFVPRPGDKEKHEDDGVVLSLVNVMNHHGGAKHCFLLVLDALTMKEIARCNIGDFTATTFHGSFVDYEYKSVSVN